MQCLRKFNLYHWLAISLLLHLSLALPFLLSTLHIPGQSRHEKLNIELFGMISNRQMEELHVGSEASQQDMRLAEQVNNTISSPDKYQTVTAESPVRVEKESEAVSEQMAVVSAMAGAAVAQRQQSIRIDQMEDSKRKYMARIARQIRANLPKLVGENGGTSIFTTIAFTIIASGDIRENSLRVQKSCGNSALDSSALRTARVSAPFEIPPEQLDMVINVYFEP